MMFMWIIPLVLLFLLLDRPGQKRDSRSWTLILLALIGLPVVGMIFRGGWFMGGPMRGGMHGYMWNGGWGGNWSWWGVVAGLLVLAVLGLVGYLAYRKGEPESEEQQILRLRLARGEITTEEYDLLRQKLNG